MVEEIKKLSEMGITNQLLIKNEMKDERIKQLESENASLQLRDGFKFKIGQRVKFWMDGDFPEEFTITSYSRVYNLESPARPRRVITVSEEDLEECN